MTSTLETWECVAGADLPDLTARWIDEDRRLIPFASSTHTFTLRVAAFSAPDVWLVVKTDGFVGYDDAPNLLISWDEVGELHDLPAGQYLAIITAIRVADGRKRVRRFRIRMLRGIPTALPATDPGPAASDAWLRTWAANPEPLLMFGDITRDGNGVVTAADIVWPDGVAGTYTAAGVTAAGYGSYTVTYGTSRTVTQPAVTRDGSGRIIARPPLTVS